jgi:hypothetical protein
MNIFERRDPALLHGGLEFKPQQLQNSFDADLAKSPKAPQIRPADPHGLGTQRQCLQDVGSAAEAAMHEHGNAAGNGFDDLRKAIDGSPAVVFPPAPMVRYDEAIHTILNAELSILGGENTSWANRR